MDIETIESFIIEGFDTNIEDDEGKTALMTASLVGNTAVVEYLINAGVDVNVADNDGKTRVNVGFIRR